MLRDRYSFDGSFLALIKGLDVEMEPELAQIDRILDDQELYQLIKADFSRRFPQSLETGRDSTPVEVLLRMLTVKRLYGFNYRETEWHTRDSLVLRQFCRVYFNQVPDHTTLNRWAQLIEPETLHAFNRRIDELAKAAKVTRARKVRTDGTVVETNIAHPSDSKLLADGVRVISRTIKRAKGVMSDAVQKATRIFRDRTRSARNQARRISDCARRSGEAAKAELKEA